LQGERTKEMIYEQNDFYFPGKRFREFDAERQDRLAMRIAMKLTSKNVTDEIRSKWMDIWRQVDEGLHSKLESKVREMSC
jgi:catalase